MACLPQLGSVVAGGCDWPLLRAVYLSNDDVRCVTSLTFLTLPALRWMETPLYCSLSEWVCVHVPLHRVSCQESLDEI